MNNTEKLLKEVGIKIDNILLPNKSVDLSLFSVVACDQYSAQKEYWTDVKNIVKNKPSSYNLILPEAYLTKDNSEYKKNITTTMREYIDNKTLVDIGKCFVYVRRHTVSGIRKGLVVSLDLEHYSYTPGNKSLMRATEKTVVERLPVRIDIRESAKIEIPHVMVLIDDKKNKLMNMLESEYKNLECLYNFELMKNGGSIEGYKVDSNDIYLSIANILHELLANSNDNFLYAVGDGNHSLAAAKTIWENKKKTLTKESQENDFARYSLVEIVNLYDEALIFEPIHRLLINVDRNKMESELNINFSDNHDLQTLQPKLDEYLSKHPESEIEYIHGKNECIELASDKNKKCVPIVFGDFEKDSLFDVVSKNGVYVRKSFSMGHAFEKRYYLESKIISI